MEFLSQYDAFIRYLPEDKNCTADALSCLPNSTTTTVASIISRAKEIKTWFELEDALLDSIKQGYQANPFTMKLHTASAGMNNIQQINGFWFVDNWLFIPNVRHIRESLFRLAHDAMGHFGSPKSYATLKDAYYWPNM